MNNIYTFTHDLKNATSTLLRSDFYLLRTPIDEGYDEMADKMVELAAQQEGFLGVEFAREQATT